MRRYTEPGAFKQALEERLRRRAAETGEDLGRLRQRAVFDRFLARLVARLGDRFVLKGGLALQLRLTRARTTRDLDLRMTGDPGQLLTDLRLAGQSALDGDFLVFIVDPDPRHPTIEGEGVVYEGRRFRVEAQLAGKIYGARFGVDVGFGDHMAYPAETLGVGELFAFAGIAPVPVRVYAREVHVAEKLHALTLPRARENTRVKDLPDLALLGVTGSFESASLRGAIEATFAQRGTHGVPTTIDAPPDGWAAPYAAMAAENGLAWASVDDLVAAVRAFLGPVLQGREGVWDPVRWSWQEPPG